MNKKTVWRSLMSSPKFIFNSLMHKCTVDALIDHAVNWADTYSLTASNLTVPEHVHTN